MAFLEKDLSVKTSNIPASGQGLFTKVFIKKGSRIVEYKGRVSNWKDVRHDNGENGYIYFMNRNHVIDASRAKAALARYSNDANGLQRISGLVNNAEYIEDGKRVFIVAKKDIQPGEEIFVGYGKEYWQTIRHNIRIEKQRQQEAEKKAALKKKKEDDKQKQLARRAAIAAKKKEARQTKLARQKEIAARKAEARRQVRLRKAAAAKQKKETQKQLAAQKALAARAKKQGRKR